MNFSSHKDEPILRDITFTANEKDSIGIIGANGVGKSTLLKLLDRYDEQVLDVDFYKVSHHGSKYSSSEEFLRILSPEISVISCSSTNSYGHPHQETLERLREAGCEIYVTMYGGQITVGTGKEQGGGEGDQTDEQGLWAEYPLITDK